MQIPIDINALTESRRLAQSIALSVHSALAGYSTTGIERAVLRLLGVAGANEGGHPRVNLVVEVLKDRGWLGEGVLSVIGKLCLAHGLTPDEAASRLLAGESDLPDVSEDRLEAWAEDQASAIRRAIQVVAKQRGALLERLPVVQAPLRYVIVATGNIHEDVIQARAAAEQGADVIAVIRSTAQSLLDHVPEGLTTEGYGGTYATQANFRLMRHALDESSERLGRYIRLTNYASGLCMAEMAALGAMERLDMMLSDSMYGILFRDINLQRTFIDQHAARTLQGWAGIIINTGEDNYLTTTDPMEAAHTVLASQFINQAFAHASGLGDPLIGLGHAFEMDPGQENGLLLQVADAQLSRQCFPEAPLKYMPPTRHMTGDIFQGHLLNALFNLTSVATRQGIHLTGVLTEGIHTPFLQDRFLALQNVDYVHRYARDFADEFEIRPGGLMARRALEVQAKALGLLRQAAERGLIGLIGEGAFAGISRNRKGGKGLEGVFEVGAGYLDPLGLLMKGEVPC